jgi:glutathione S-transferase
MRLYDFPASPHCLKVRAVAHELGVDLDILEVNILRGESRSRDFERLQSEGHRPGARGGGRHVPNGPR